MQYEYTEAELNGLSGDGMAADEAQAAHYAQQAAAQAEWERQAHYHDEQAQQWDEADYYAGQAYAAGY